MDWFRDRGSNRGRVGRVTVGDSSLGDESLGTVGTRTTISAHEEAK